MHRITTSFIEEVCKSRDAIRYSFTVASVDNQPIKTVATGGCEVQKGLRSHWAKYIPPLENPFMLYMDACFMNKTKHVFQLLLTSRYLQLRGLGRNHFSEY